MAGTVRDAFVTRFREAGGPEWTVTTAGRDEPSVVDRYHRLAEDVPAITVRLYPDSHATAVELSYGDTDEPFSDGEAASQYVEALLETLPGEGGADMTWQDMI